MASIESLQNQVGNSVETPEWSAAYQTIFPLNLYDSSALTALATQLRVGLHIKIQRVLDQPLEAISAFQVWSSEDDYSGWVSPADLDSVQPTMHPYTPPNPSAADINTKIADVIAFAKRAMAEPNVYLWGGTIGPNYDCSGLVQHAFSEQGIWLPRDAYQQESFVEPIQNPGERPEDLIPLLQPGDLIFFGTPVKATHVAIHLENGSYIHSSGKDQGRNGIGLDVISATGELVSQTYYAQFRGAGRVRRSYQPGDKTWLNPSP